MKARKVCFCALVCFISACVFADEPSPAQVKEAQEPVVNVELADVDEIYVRVVADKVTDIDWKQLEDEIGRRLEENGLKLASADVSEIDEEQKQKMIGVLERRGGSTRGLKIYSAKVPELIVRISVLQGTQSGPCVFHIQTSFAREVYLRGLRSRMKAEVWRIDVPIGIADANQCDMAVRAGTLGQVDTFIAEWKKANASKITADSREEADAVTSPAQKLYGQAGQKGQYEYVASKNSKVFHKRDCRAAARISPENLIGFNSREEAINSGRRPCKICKP
jgi:hypothetical protein